MKKSRFVFVTFSRLARCDKCKRRHRHFFIRFLGFGVIRFVCVHCWRFSTECAVLAAGSRRMPQAAAAGVGQ